MELKINLLDRAEIRGALIALKALDASFEQKRPTAEIEVEETIGADTLSAATITYDPKLVKAAVEPIAATELDAEGLPWDERIHSSGKTKMKSGVWTKKRGLDEATYAAVRAEYLGADKPEHQPSLFEQQEPEAPAAQLSLPEFLQKLTGAMGEGKIAMEQVTQACNAQGLNAPFEAASKPGSMSAILEELGL